MSHAAGGEEGEEQEGSFISSPCANAGAILFLPGAIVAPQVGIVLKRFASP